MFLVRASGTHACPKALRLTGGGTKRLRSSNAANPDLVDAKLEEYRLTMLKVTGTTGLVPNAQQYAKYIQDVKDFAEKTKTTTAAIETFSGILVQVSVVPQHRGFSIGPIGTHSSLFVASLLRYRAEAKCDKDVLMRLSEVTSTRKYDRAAASLSRTAFADAHAGVEAKSKFLAYLKESMDAVCLYNMTAAYGSSGTVDSAGIAKAILETCVSRGEARGAAPMQT